MERADIAIIGTGPAGVSAAVTAAIRNKKVFMLEERFMYSTTQYFADAVEKMAKTVYPECFQ